MVLGIGFLLTVSLVLSAVIGGITKYFGGGDGTNVLWTAIDFSVSLDDHTSVHADI